MEKRKCKHCGKLKPPNEFRYPRRGKQCYACFVARQRQMAYQRYHKNPQLAVQRVREYHQTPTGKEVHRQAVRRYKQTPKGLLAQKRSYDNYMLKRGGIGSDFSEVTLYRRSFGIISLNPAFQYDGGVGDRILCKF